MKTIDLKEPVVQEHINSREDEELITFVKGRCSDMSTARNIVDNNWKLYQQQMDAIWQPYPDGRSSFAIPMTRALVERGIAEEIRIPPTRIVRAERSEYDSKAIAYESARDYVGRVNNFDWELLKNSYVCWTYGTSIIYTHFERTVKEQYEASFSTLDDVEYKKKYIVQNGILCEDFDINNFYPDNRVIEWADAVDCWAEQIIPFETFQELANQKVYKNIDKVSPTSYYLNTTTTNYSVEERFKQGKYVHIKNYWNLAKDMYVAIANDQVVIRCHPIWTTKKGAKCLPFTMRRLGYNQRSLYGIGMGYYGQQLQSNMNDISEMIFDGVRRSTEETMVLGNNIDIEGQKMVYGNRILKANGILAGNIDRLQGTPPNQAIFQARDMLLRDINRFVGLDLENLVADASTAFQANLIAESQQKQVNVWLKNRDMAYEDMEDKIKDLITTYLPLDVPYRIVDSKDDIEPDVPTIEITGKKYDKRTKRFSTTKNPNSKFAIDITAELLQGDYFVDTTTNTTDTASGAIRKAQILDYVNALAPVINADMLAKQSGNENLISVKQTMEELAKAYNIPQKDTSNEIELKEKAEEMKDQLKAIAQQQGISAPESLNQPTDGQTQAQPIPTGTM